jgi:hypothetical protein
MIALFLRAAKFSRKKQRGGKILYPEEVIATKARSHKVFIL